MLVRQVSTRCPVITASLFVTCAPSQTCPTFLRWSSSLSLIFYQQISSSLQRGKIVCHKPILHVEPTKLRRCDIEWLSRHQHLPPLRTFSAAVESSEDTSPGKTRPVKVDRLVSQSHMDGLAQKFGCKVAEVKSLIVDYKFLMHMDLELVESKVNLLVAYNLSLAFVREHLRLVYQTSYSELERRLQIMKDIDLLHSTFLDMDKLAHLLECRKSEFDRCLKYTCDQRDALEGYTDQLSYLQMRLTCSEKTARGLLHSYPLERRVSNVKLKTLLDFFLIEAQRGPEFVINHRKLMVFSVERLRKRWEVIQKAKIESEHKMVIVWSIPKRDFEEEYREFLVPSETELSK